MKPRKPIGTSRAKQLRKYRKMALQFLISHSHCVVCCRWLPLEDRQNHHKYGRVGRLLTWEPGFRCVCQRCHEDIKRFPKAAILGGYLGPMGTWNDYNRAVAHYEANK